ncbi:hypothetical protein [Kitasatospora sp. NPDC097691]|uniref:hypothetical protein n=1 Tax=Kitasatospora sp. NPDC097691 TaxID=3157231 RepID=UPI0033191B5A
MDEGGESACWLERVCPECGRLRERPGPAPCEHCGAVEDGAPRADESSREAGAPGDAARRST